MSFGIWRRAEFLVWPKLLHFPGHPAYISGISDFFSQKFPSSDFPKNIIQNFGNSEIFYIFFNENFYFLTFRISFFRFPCCIQFNYFRKNFDRVIKYFLVV